MINIKLKKIRAQIEQERTDRIAKAKLILVALWHTL